MQAPMIEANPFMMVAPPMLPEPINPFMLPQMTPVLQVRKGKIIIYFNFSRFSHRYRKLNRKFSVSRKLNTMSTATTGSWKSNASKHNHHLSRFPISSQVSLIITLQPNQSVHTWQPRNLLTVQIQSTKRHWKRRPIRSVRMTLDRRKLKTVRS